MVLIKSMNYSGIKIKDKDLMNFYQRELKIYITKERFKSLQI